MRRVHTLEFEDLACFPGWLRTCMTNNIVVFARLLGVREALGGLVSRVLKKEQLDAVVDLGSGGGGVMPDVLAAVRQQAGLSDVSLIMTDLYPNQDAVARFGEGRADGLRYLPTPVDATHLADAPAGLKTMCNCFHHMRPEAARAILKSAAESRQPLLIYEMGPNVPWPLWLLSLPIALPLIALTAAVLSAFVRPLTWRQVVFTYVIPLVPIFYGWDGHASSPRIYTPSDLDELLDGLTDDAGYRWEKGPVPLPGGRTLGSYLLGVPVKGG